MGGAFHCVEHALWQPSIGYNGPLSSSFPGRWLQQRFHYLLVGGVIFNSHLYSDKKEGGLEGWSQYGRRWKNHVTHTPEVKKSNEYSTFIHF